MQNEWKQEFRKRARTRFCLDFAFYSKVDDLLERNEIEMLKELLQTSPSFIRDLLEIIRTGRPPSWNNSQPPPSSQSHAFFSQPEPLDTFCKNTQTKAGLCLRDFIEREVQVAKAGLECKRIAVIQQGLGNKHPQKNGTEKKLSFSHRTTNNASEWEAEYIIPRITQLPHYVTTLPITVSVKSDEATEMQEFKLWQKARRDAVGENHVMEDELMDQVIFRTVQEFGPSPKVFSALTNKFKLSTEEKEETAAKICSQSSLNRLYFDETGENFNLVGAELGHVMNVDADSKLVDSYRSLFCANCLVFDCNAHVHRSAPLNRAATRLQVKAVQQQQQLLRSSTSKATLAFALHAHRLFPDDEGNASKLLKCFDANAAQELTRSHSFTVTKADRSREDAELAESKAAIVASDWQIPCNHEGKCAQANCTCIQRKRRCLPTCACSSPHTHCGNANLGCKCTTTCIESKHCPCFESGYQCDPAVCTNCACHCGMGKTDLAVGMSSIHRGGWGTFAKQDIAQNTLVAEYCGEIIENEEMIHRCDLYDCDEMFYRFESRKRLGSEMMIDSYRKASAVKYCNNVTGSGANCKSYCMLSAVDGQMHIFLVALRDIKAGEELSFDYMNKGG